MPKLTITKQSEAGAIRLLLKGNLDQAAETVLLDSAAGIAGTCIIDMDGVTLISSNGVKEWRDFLRSPRAPKDIVIDRFRPHVAMIFNMVEGCVANVRIRSFFGQFACVECSTTESVHLRVGVDVSENGDELTKHRCSRCGSVLRAEFSFDDYCDFLRQSRALVGGRGRSTAPDPVRGTS